jgi:hypothetical protein
MLAVIMQPTFLPWVGYFDLIDQADVFVFLETVQFEKQTWQQRNRIRTSNGLEWLTVPVFIKGKFGQLIREVEIRTTDFPHKYIKTLGQHYGKTPYYREYKEELEGILMSVRKDPSLARLNITLIQWLSRQLGVSSRFITASELFVEGKRSERIISILRRVGADLYMSPQGSLDYLLKDRAIFKAGGFPVLIHNYTHPKYRQQYKPFTPGASAVDLLFNEGPGASSIIRAGRLASIPLDKFVMSTNDTKS